MSKLYVKERALVERDTGKRTKIYQIYTKESFWNSEKPQDYGDHKWIWYENDGKLFGEDSFYYFTSKEKADKCLENLLANHTEY